MPLQESPDTHLDELSETGVEDTHSVVSDYDFTEALAEWFLQQTDYHQTDEINIVRFILTQILSARGKRIEEKDLANAVYEGNLPLERQHLNRKLIDAYRILHREILPFFEDTFEVNPYLDEQENLRFYDLRFTNNLPQITEEDTEFMLKMAYYLRRCRHVRQKTSSIAKQYSFAEDVELSQAVLAILANGSIPAEKGLDQIIARLPQGLVCRKTVSGQDVYCLSEALASHYLPMEPDDKQSKCLRERFDKIIESLLGCKPWHAESPKGEPRLDCKKKGGNNRIFFLRRPDLRVVNARDPNPLFRHFEDIDGEVDEISIRARIAILQNELPTHASRPLESDELELLNEIIVLAVISGNKGMALTGRNQSVFKSLAGAFPYAFNDEYFAIGRDKVYPGISILAADGYITNGEENLPPNPALNPEQHRLKKGQISVGAVPLRDPNEEVSTKWIERLASAVEGADEELAKELTELAEDF